MTHDGGLASWLQLTLTPGLGAASLRELLRRHGSPEGVLAQSRAELARSLPAPVLAALESGEVRRAVDAALAWAGMPGHSIVTLADTEYPKLLLEAPDPPSLLYLRGRAELLQRPAIAVVGSRNASAQGERNAETFAKSLSDAGSTVVSGLASGIDAAAHRGALQGEGSTIAVLGTGIDVVYPPRNRDLAQHIAADGLLVSEFALSTPPVAHNFPRRNRLISGLARGCLVVEAALGSGSLITARLAAEQGREVFAIPGSIHSPLSKGCHALIKSGAKLVESTEDILAELGQWSGGAPNAPKSADRGSPNEDKLLAEMGYEPVDLDTLSARLGLPVERLSSELLRLEMEGRVAALPGGRFQRLA